MALQAGKRFVTLGDLLPGVESLNEAAKIPVFGLTSDSRQVSAGDLMLAYPGLTVDGRDFIGAAIAAGASVVLAEAEGWMQSDDVFSVPVVAIKNLSAKVSGIAAKFYGEPSLSLQVTGVTGTNGKTTCSQLLAQLYSKLGQKAGVIGTLGFGVIEVESGSSNKSDSLLGGSGSSLCDTGMTTPNAIQLQQILAGMREEGVAHSFMEVSSHSLDQGRVAAVNFNTAVFTNLSRDHLDYHGSLESYAEAKAALFTHPELKLAVINSDDPMADQMIAGLNSSAQCLRYSLSNSDADIWASQVSLSEYGIFAHVHTPWGEGELHTSLVGSFNLSNLLAVLTVACGNGWELQPVLTAMSGLSPVAGRMEIVAVDAPSASLPMVVVDYAHTPDALEKALLALRGHCRGQLWCVFGCGGDRDAGKRPQMGEVAARLSHHTVVTSDNPRSENPEHILIDILAGMPDELAVRVGTDRAMAIAEAIESAGSQDCVLIAGKGHENYQEIDGVRTPFSDVEQAREVLLRRSKQLANGGLH